MSEVFDKGVGWILGLVASGMGISEWKGEECCVRIMFCG